MNVIKVKSVVLDEVTAKEEQRLSNGGALVTLENKTTVKMNRMGYALSKPEAGWFYIINTDGANTFSKTDPTAKVAKAKVIKSDDEIAADYLKKEEKKAKAAAKKKAAPKKVVAKKKAPKKKK